MRKILFVVASMWAMLFAGPVFSQAIEIGSEIDSVYSKLDLDGACKPYELYEQGGSFTCPGYAGYGVLFAEGDLRNRYFTGLSVSGLPRAHLRVFQDLTTPAAP